MSSFYLLTVWLCFFVERMLAQKAACKMLGEIDKGLIKPPVSVINLLIQLQTRAHPELITLFGFKVNNFRDVILLLILIFRLYIVIAKHKRSLNLQEIHQNMNSVDSRVVHYF